MRGMSIRDGRAIEGAEHLRQSIADILSTPRGSRVMRRDYGSVLPELIDQPFNPATRMRLFGATAVALMRWEPRFRLKRVALAAGDAPGAFRLDLEGERTDLPGGARAAALALSLNLGRPAPVVPAAAA